MLAVIMWAALALALSLSPSLALAARIGPASPPAGMEDVPDALAHVPKIGGALWFVSPTGSDTAGGRDPHSALATIGEALSQCATGDAIVVAAGTYDETGLDIGSGGTKDGIRIWGEPGATIADTTTGTQTLLISGSGCEVSGLVLGQAGQIGVNITGASARLLDTRITASTTGVRVAGLGASVDNVSVRRPSAVGFEIAAGGVKLERCATTGDGGATTGYHWTAGSRGVAHLCRSSGHGAAGYYLDAGVSLITLHDCATGGGDGRWVDEDMVNVFADLHYADEVVNNTVFVGGGPGSQNIYKITGSVLIVGLTGHVHTATSADVGALYLELSDGTVTADVTDSPGRDASSLPVGTLLHKIDEAAVQIAIAEADQVRLYEDATRFHRDPVFTIIAKQGGTSYLRVTYAGVATSGVIQWHAHWEPVTHDGFVEAQ